MIWGSERIEGGDGKATKWKDGKKIIVREEVEIGDNIERDMTVYRLFSEIGENRRS